MSAPDPDPNIRASERHIRFAVWSALLFSVLVGTVSFFAVRSTTRTLHDLAFEDASGVIEVQKARISGEVAGRTARSFLLTGDEQALAAMQAARAQFATRMEHLSAELEDEDQRELMDEVREADRAYQQAADSVIALRAGGASAESVSAAFVLHVQPAREELDRAIAGLASAKERRLGRAAKHAQTTVALALEGIGLLAAMAVVGAAVSTLLLTRSLRTLGEQRAETAHHLARLTELNRDLDAFAGRVAHDLRNLLTPIGLLVPLLRHSPGRAETDARVADRLQRAFDRSLSMLDGLLAFSRSSRRDPLAVCSVASVVDDALDQLAPLASRLDATIQRDVDDATVACSRELLNVVVLNLVGNAVKFLEGRPRRMVWIRSRRVGPSCELTVSDSGPGIPEADRERIFEPFYRVPGTEAAGSGIGLATVQRIVQAHGGTIRVESSGQEGASFRLELPVANQGADSRAAGARGADAAPGSPSCQPQAS